MSSVSGLGKEVLQRCLMRRAFAWRLARGADSALTFDDGPHEVYTPRILELLARHDVKATFFVVGEAACRAPALVRRIVAEGHCIASHTYSHRELPSLTRAELREELERCRGLLREMTGRDTTLVRPPRGRIDPTSLFWMWRWGYRLIHWTRTYSDYLQDGSAPLLHRIRARGLGARDIALFHDNNVHTVEALSEVLPDWLAHGRTFITLERHWTEG